MRSTGRPPEDSRNRGGARVAAAALVAACALGLALAGGAQGRASGVSDALDADALRALLERVAESARAEAGGETAQYIPALAEADPDRFALAVATADGTLVSVGDADVPFAIMSAAKPFTAALLLEQRGTDFLLEAIGAEPTGMPFDSILALELHPEGPMNPLVNAGAIAAVSHLEAEGLEARWGALAAFHARLAGEELPLMDDVLASVNASNFHNRAIVNLLEDRGALGCDPAEALEVYDRQSCVAVTTEQLARMGATLAAGGTNPATGERVLDAELTDEVLALMLVAGFYDEAGAWAYEVGLPAKSGVGGGVVAVAPGRLAIAAFSPRLNESGNSVRALAAVRGVAEALDLSVFRIPAAASGR